MAELKENYDTKEDAVKTVSSLFCGIAPKKLPPFQRELLLMQENYLRFFFLFFPAPLFGLAGELADTTGASSVSCAASLPDSRSV